MRSAALRHGFGKGCLGEAGGTNQKKAPSRVPSLIREGSDRLERERRFGAKKKPEAQPGSRPLPVAGAVRFDRKLYGITKKGGACVGNRRFLPHMERSGSPRRSRHQKKKAPFGALSFGAEDGTRTHTPKYWLLRPERLPFRHFRLFHFGPAHSQNSRPTSTRIIPFLALACQFPGLSPPFGGCLSTGVVLG